MLEPVIENAEALKKELLSALDKGNASIDVSGIETLDLAGFQVLVAFWKEGAARGKEVSFTGTVSEALAARLVSLGLVSIPMESGAQLSDFFSRLGI